MPRHSRSFVILMIFLSIAGIVSPLYAQTEISISASQDNTLYEDAEGALSNGAGEYFFVGRTGPSNGGMIRRGLIQFDVTNTIPAGATIIDASLTLNMSKTISGSQAVSLHRVLASWGEGTSNATSNEGGGAPAAVGDVTWIHRFYDTVPWAIPGGDYAAAASASQFVGTNGFYTWGSTLQMVSDIQHWLDNPSENFGWVLVGNEATSSTAKRFDAREHPMAGNRPVLTVMYTSPTGIEDHSQSAPAQFRLAQNYPNPFNADTVIRYWLPLSAPVKLEIFNIIGQKVKTLVNDVQSAGEHIIQWNRRDDSGELLGSGVYIYRISTGENVQSRKMILLN